MNFIVSLEIYPFDIMVSIGETDVQLDKRLIRFIDPHEIAAKVHCVDGTVKARTVMFSNSATLLRMPIKPKTNLDYAILQHEIFHAVTMIMDKIGMKLIVMESDEAYAYLIQHVTLKIYERL